MQIILDTSVILAMLLSKGENNVRTIIDLARERKLQLVLCKETLQELKETISTDEFKRFPHYKPHYIGQFIAWYQHNTKVYTLPSIRIQISRDPTDTMFAVLAKISQAEYLVSGDKDLLVLKKIGKTQIVKPKEFINKHIF